VLLAIAAACKMNEKKQPPPAPVVAPVRSPYCPGTPTWGSGAHTCTNDGECGKDERCYLDGIPDRSGGCGLNVPDEFHCQQDRDCKRGQICQQRETGRCEPRIRECVAGCTQKPCDAGMQCGSDGRCKAISCRDGYACPTGTWCSGIAADAHGCGAQPCWEGSACPPDRECVRDHGCMQRTCTKTDDCPCGLCVESTCRARPGVCGPAVIPSPP
jgi:hypothetical protein